LNNQQPQQVSSSVKKVSENSLRNS